jgi:hypothetical protein
MTDISYQRLNLSSRVACKSFACVHVIEMFSCQYLMVSFLVVIFMLNCDFFLIIDEHLNESVTL